VNVSLRRGLIRGGGGNRPLSPFFSFFNPKKKRKKKKEILYFDMNIKVQNFIFLLKNHKKGDGERFVVPHKLFSLFKYVKEVNQ
jgi:hypothetical protein